MPTIPITVRDKRAFAPKDTTYVTGNSDYIAVFTFDAEWDSHPTKTARFSTETQFIDMVFTGTECPVPLFHTGEWLKIGVFAGNLVTTTNAAVRMRDGVLEDEGLPNPPAPDVYVQILDRLNEIELGGGGGSGGTIRLGHALAYDDQGRIAVQVASDAQGDNTLPITSAAVDTIVGNIDILLQTI